MKQWLSLRPAYELTLLPGLGRLRPLLCPSFRRFAALPRGVDGSPWFSIGRFAPVGPTWDGLASSLVVTFTGMGTEKLKAPAGAA